MINWNDLKNLDVKRIDLTKIDLTRFDLPEFDLPEFNVPGFDTADLAVDADRVLGLARDAAYASVGVAVVAVQKLDAQRRELTDQFTTQVRKAVGAIA